MPYAVKARGKWRIANKAKAEIYGEPRPDKNGPGIAADTEVWSEDETTAWICLVGQEDAFVELES